MLSHSILATVLLLAAAGDPAKPTDSAATPARLSEVRDKGAQVMPFSLDQTLHTFDKTDSGGVQRVRARNAAADQIDMIRSHLQTIAQSFMARDFSAPAHIHGADMPGMAEMKAANPGDLTVSYRAVDDGAELDYASRSPKVVAAIHRWFDAQLSDHGGDASTSVPVVKLAELSWLAGTWVIADRDKRIEEIWTAPSANMMIGMSRTLRGDRTTSFEFMRIAAREDGVFYIAQPRGKPPVEFPLQSWDGTQAVFVNPGNDDHLKRIVYRNGKNGSMTTRVEGADDGKDFSEEYPYHRQRSHRAD